MKVARFVLKIVALSLTTAAVVCAVIAYSEGQPVFFLSFSPAQPQNSATLSQ